LSTEPAVDQLTRRSAIEVLRDRPLVLLTGAGLSTDSGIPDYRGPGSVPRSPMTYQEFVSGPEPQQRYWARSHLGWGVMDDASPNAGHLAAAALDPDLLITQNVDGLHERAGSASMVALHGRIADVVCLDCRAGSTRAALHERLRALNPDVGSGHRSGRVLPDGDVELGETSDFVVAGCEQCAGRLKPDVVFFGENVPAHRVERCYAAVDSLAANDGALLVAGTSLSVMSGFRFVRRAAKIGVPVVIVNRGSTRGDELATYAVDAGTSPFLVELVAARSGLRAS